jgi:hypothetical protein
MPAKKKANSTSFKPGQSGNLNGRKKGVKDSRTVAKELKNKMNKILPSYSLVERQKIISDALTKYFDPKLSIQDYEALIQKINKDPSKISLVDSLAHVIIEEAIIKKDKHTRHFLFTQILQNPVRATRLNEIKQQLKKIVKDIKQEWSNDEISVDHVANLYLEVSTEFIDDPEVYEMVRQLFKGLIEFIMELEKLNLEKTKIEYSRNNVVTIAKLNEVLQLVNKNLQRHLNDSPEVYEKVYNNINADLSQAFMAYLPHDLNDVKEVN